MRIQDAVLDALEKNRGDKKINFAFQMDEFYSDNFFDGNAPIGWSERDW